SRLWRPATTSSMTSRSRGVRVESSASSCLSCFSCSRCSLVLMALAVVAITRTRARPRHRIRGRAARLPVRARRRVPVARERGVLDRLHARQRGGASDPLFPVLRVGVGRDRGDRVLGQCLRRCVLMRGFAGTDLLVWVGLLMVFYGIIYALREN